MIRVTTGGIHELVFMSVAMEANRTESPPREPAAPAAMAFDASRETGSAAACASAAKPASMAAESEPPTWQPRRVSLPRSRSVARSMRFCAASVAMPRVAAISRMLRER